jgi:serine/threonine-protein kinase RsbW
MRLQNNSKLFLFSDGMIEWGMNGESRVFGLPGLQKHFEKKGLTEKSIMTLISSIKQQQQKDDMSFILIDVSDTFKKHYYADLHNMKEIIDDFKLELESRYENHMLMKAGHCFYELIHNAIEHGNDDDVSKMVSVHITFFINGLNIKISDQGPGFDWRKLNFDRSGTISDERGRGLFLVNTFANELKFNKKGNEVHCFITE